MTKKPETLIEQATRHRDETAQQHRRMVEATAAAIERCPNCGTPLIPRAEPYTHNCAIFR